MLNAILQLESQGECSESATEAVLMVGYTSDGISNQEQTRWLSWNVDGGVRSFDFARNPGEAMPQMLASLEMLEMGKMYTITLKMGTNDVSRGESRKMMRLQDKLSCILEEQRIYLDTAILTICTIPYKMMSN